MSRLEWPRRLIPGFTAAHALIALAWLAFALGIAPAIVAEAYHGRSLPVLNRILAATSHRPLDHYQALWQSLAVAVLLAIAVHALLDRTIRHCFPARGWRWGVSGFAAMFLAVATLAGPRQDYPAYLEIWNVVRAGADPWWIHPRFGYPINAYGPLFPALAPLAWLNPLAPKLLFAGAYLAAGVLLLGRVPARNWDESGRLGRWPLALLLASPYPWVEIAWFGHFDILIALGCVGALALADRGREAASGALLALAVLLKYLPVVLLPFLALENRRLRPRLLGGFTLVVLAGCALAWTLWEKAPVRAVSFAASRGSVGLSPWRFAHAALGLDLDALALPLLAAAGLTLFAYAQSRRLDTPTACASAVLLTLLLYRVVFPQYAIVLYSLLLACWHAAPLRWSKSPRLRASALAHLALFTLYDTLDFATDGVLYSARWSWVEQYAGAPALVIGAWLLAELLVADRRVR